MGGLIDSVFKAVGGVVDTVAGALMPDPPKAPQLPSFVDNSATGGAAATSLLAPADPSNGTAQADRDAAAEAERQRVARARGYDSTNPTGGLGDTSTANLAAKNLLGA